MLDKLITFIYSQINESSSLEMDIGDHIECPLFNSYEIGGTIPWIENPVLAATLNKKW